MLWEGGNRKNGTTAGSKSNVESLICINRCYNHGSRQDRPVAIKLRAFGCLQPQLLWWCHLVNAHEGKAGMVLLAGKLCDPYLSAVCVHWCKKALYKILFLSFPFLSLTKGRSHRGGHGGRVPRAPYHVPYNDNRQFVFEADF